LDEKPKDFPKKSRVTMIAAIKVPDIYHGHGCDNVLMISFMQVLILMDNKYSQ
jgi:hypothetical protein